MYCKRCEKKLEPNETICPYCGTNIKIKKIKKIVFMTILIIGIIAGISFFGINIFKEQKQLEKLNNQNVKVITLNKKDYISFGQYTFKIPNNLQYNTAENYIYVATSDLTSSFKMNIVNSSYETIKGNDKKFVESIVESGINVASYYITTIGDQEYMLIATIQNNKNYLYAIRTLDNTKIVQVLVESTTDTGYRSALLNVNDIVKEYTKVKFNLNIEYKSSLNDFLSNGSNKDINLGDLFKVEQEESE